MDLSQLQRDSREWREKNFPPEDRTVELQLMGVVEELGELSHAILKSKQGIRGEAARHHAEAVDAVGDLVIYLCGLCDAHGIDLDSAVDDAWAVVKRRDWKKNPTTGVH